MEKEAITYEDVREWIVRNSDDKAAMDEINRLTYVFTSKYAERATREERD